LQWWWGRVQLWGGDAVWAGVGLRKVSSCQASNREGRVGRQRDKKTPH
jgi:hypothetical protein